MHLGDLLETLIFQRNFIVPEQAAKVHDVRLRSQADALTVQTARRSVQAARRSARVRDVQIRSQADTLTAQAARRSAQAARRSAEVRAARIRSQADALPANAAYCAKVTYFEKKLLILKKVTYFPGV